MSRIKGFQAFFGSLILGRYTQVIITYAALIFKFFCTFVYVGMQSHFECDLGSELKNWHGAVQLVCSNI